MTKMIAEECGKEKTIQNNSNRLMSQNSWLLFVFSPYLVEDCAVFTLSQNRWNHDL